MLTPALPIPTGGTGSALALSWTTRPATAGSATRATAPGYGSYAYGCLETGVGVVALGNGPWGRHRTSKQRLGGGEHGLTPAQGGGPGPSAPPDPPPPPTVPRPARGPPPASDPRPTSPRLAALAWTYAAWNPWLPQVVVRLPPAATVSSWSGPTATPRP